MANVRLHGAAAQSGRRVNYGSLADLITSLEEAQAAHHPHGAMLFFQLMTRRYQFASTVLTSNKGFEEWGDVFGDDQSLHANQDPEPATSRRRRARQEVATT